MFESEYAKSEYIEKDNVVLHVWKKEAHFDDYRDPVKASLEMLREHKNSIFIVDARNGFEDVKEDVEWGFEWFLPELKKTGCKVWGFILPEVSDIEGEIDLWTREVEKNFRVIRAVSYDEIVALAKSEPLKVRRIEDSDAKAVSDLIRKTISISNKKDYPEDIMDQLIGIETPEHVLERASWTHFYVVLEGEAIIGCGAIGPFWGKEDESSLFTIFVDPDKQGKGIGRLIMNTLENDEYFLRAKRIEIPASITGVPFYLKMGYHYKDGITEPDEEHLIRMEKNR
jgi:N-acetylglutamate synthase-like GNAT family acetyltransferase